MAVTVHVIMNPELLTLRENMRADDALDVLLELEITAAPVVDKSGGRSELRHSETYSSTGSNLG